ncbi:hypothetical protein [Streptomyces xinghaiensis]|uniref:hypothetical protein n=1 Tax=Streptomyces xinghaiensis TaxID=1038928 RepID=UPI002E0E19EF|nr:hypothetical protein OG463_15085 [Streptomyces xinghaiensis]
MASWTSDHKVAISVGLMGAIAVIVAAIITGCMKSDSVTVDQETGRDGTVRVGSQR